MSDPLDTFFGIPSSWTLGELSGSGHRVVFECVHCGHRAPLDLEALIRKHGPRTRIAYFRRNMACIRCGRTGQG
ncbi:MULTISPECIES: hypothetical protein [unclassified Roseitalea]|uniref:hypothetical protein n=1 Tax=unclassified Roseitalea TaxID=2639107 RepID=UPI00273E80F0|nr:MULTISPECIES: hypothetical protein [unclassified Roseitalea]